MTRRILAAAALAATAALTVPASPASAIVCPVFTKIQPVDHPLTGKPVTNICVPDPSQLPLPDPCPYSCDVAQQ